MTNRKLFVCILASLGLFAGCSDDSASNSTLIPTNTPVSGAPCTAEGTKVCNIAETESLVCTDGKYVATKCGEGEVCTNGECKESGNTTNECTPETYQSFHPVCNGNESTVCTKDGELVTTKCADGFVCQDGYCTNNESCDGSYEAKCKDEGMLHCVKGVVVYEECGGNKFCSNGVCIQKVPCEANTLPECDGQSGVKVCKGGYWHYEKCDVGSICDSSKNACVKGDCTPGTSSCSPDKTSVFKCVGGKLEETLCDGATCENGECHDPEYCETDKYMSSCTEDGQLKHCVSGKVVVDPCTGNLECYNGACVSDGPCDKNMTPVCVSASEVQTCGENNHKVTTACKQGEVCLNGVCQTPNETCMEGQKECTSANVYHNCVDGKWVSGYCNVATEVCIAGDCTSNTAVTSCNIMDSDTCDSDSVSIVKCEYGYKVKYACAEDQVCVDGKCTDKTPPVPGDDCDDTKPFDAACVNDGATTTCVDGKVVEIPCGEDKVCKAGACVDKTCDPNNFTPECSGDFDITACKDGKIVKENCGENKHCANNACVDDANVDDPCHPQTFAASCTTEGKILMCDGSTMKVKAVECTGSTPVCLNGACVACDPNKYEANCTDGHKYSCESNGNLKDSLCKTGNVCYNGECAECDPTKTAPTCLNGKVHICNSNGIFEDSSCPEGYTCANGECTNKCSTNADCADAHYVCDGGQCKFQAECTVGKQECDGTTGVKVCKAPGLWETTPCATDQICRGEGICMGKECDPATYGKKCDGNTPTVCINGYIKKETECSGICLNGSCAECDSATTKPTCSGEPTAHYCIDNKYKQVTCTQPQEYCQPGEGCISVCGKDYKPSCNSQGQLVTCDYQNRKLKTEDCSFDSQCVDGVCEKIVGKSCIPATYANKCHDVTGVTYVEYCDIATQKVIVASCNNSNQFCGTVNGETNCFSTCTEAEIEQNLTWCSTWWDDRQYIGKCFAGKDYKGATKYGILRQSGLCTDNISISCRVDKTSGHNNHVVFDYVACDMMGSTCSNGSCGFASCGALSSTCENNIAKNCFYDTTYDSGIGGNVYYEMNCTTLGGTCRVLNYDGVNKAICDKSAGNFSGIGTVSTLGTCNNGTLHTLYFGNATGTNYGAHSLNCHNQCVTETKSGATYSYCK